MMSSMYFENTSIALLAGGESKRLGKDKTRLTRDGILLAAHLYYRLSDIFEEVFMVTKCGMKFPAFPGRIVCDQWDESASLIGLAESLRNTLHPWVFVISVDTVFFKQSMLVEVCSAPRDAVEAIITRVNGKFEPLFSLYHKNLLPGILRHVEEKNFRIYKHFENWKTRIVDFHADDRNALIYNLNTPGDMSFATARGWVD